MSNNPNEDNNLNKDCTHRADVPSDSERPLSLGEDQVARPMNGSGQSFGSSVEDDPVGSDISQGLNKLSEDCTDTDPKSVLVVAPLLTTGNPKAHRFTDSADRPTGGEYGKINDPDCKKKYFALICKFSDITAKICSYMENSPPSSLLNFFVFCKARLCHMRLGLSKSTENQKLKRPNDWIEMFENLTDIKAWDCLNYNLLKDLLDRYPQESETYSKLKKMMEEYHQEVCSFMSETLLLDFLDVYKECFPDDYQCSEGCEMLKVKIHRDGEKMTLHDFNVDQGHILSQFRLHHYILHLVTANVGCVVLYWSLPEEEVSYIKQVCEFLKPDFGQAGISEISVGDLVLYQTRNVYQIKDNENLLPVSDVMSNYDELYEKSIKNPEEFWHSMAMKTLIWMELCTKENTMKECDISKGVIKWFDGTLNASVNCLDQHVATTPNKVAIIWEKNDGTYEKISYCKLLKMTCQIANVLQKKGVEKGDVVFIYMPSSPMAVASMLACTRIGAIHSVAYAVLKLEELTSRIQDANAKLIITSNVARIGGKKFHLKHNVDKAISAIQKGIQKGMRRSGSRHGSEKSLDSLSEEQSSVQYHEEARPTVLMTSRYPLSEEEEVPWNEKYDFELEEEMKKCPSFCDPVAVEAEHPMFIMYTSGTTAGSTGIRHSTAGYLLYVALTHKYVFDYKPGDVFGCMAALGWITGHSYIVYGPLCNGATTVLYEGTATYPDRDRYWKAIQNHKINQFYVTPSVITELLKDTPNIKSRFDLSSLKTIATVGEPLHSKVLEWFRTNVGHKDCKFVDTWWQTEIGGISLVIDHDLKDLPQGNFPAKPFFGVEPVIIDPDYKGEIMSKEQMTNPGYLCLKQPLPGMARSIVELTKGKGYFKETYFTYPGYGYFTHDFALLSKDRGYRVTGRLTDAIRIQGVWLDIAYIEDQMNKSDNRIIRTSVVGIPNKTNNDDHDHKGTCMFVEIEKDASPEEQESITSQLTNLFKELIGAWDTDDFEVFVLLVRREWALTHSGKVIRSVYQDFLSLTNKLYMGKTSEKSIAVFRNDLWVSYDNWQ